MGATRDIGLLISMLHTSSEHEWETVAQNLKRLRPRFSSLAIDIWTRKNVSAVEARQRVHQKYSHVLALFSRVNFFDTAPHVGARGGEMDRHVKPVFSNDMHWRSTFSNRDAWSFTGEEGQLHHPLPRLLGSMDADVQVNPKLIQALDRIADVLSKSAAARHGTSGASFNRSTEARLARAMAPAQPRAEAGCSEYYNELDYVRRRSNASFDRGAAFLKVASEAKKCSDEARTPLWPEKLVHPMFVSQSGMKHEGFHKSCMGEMGSGLLRKEDVGPCTQVRPPEEVGSGLARNAWFSRGPYCPSAMLYFFHRDDLPMMLASFEYWRANYLKRHASVLRSTAPETWRDWYALRWEFTTCKMLAPDEATLFLHW